MSDNVHAANARKVFLESVAKRKAKAILRSDFLEQDNAVIVKILQDDLSRHLDKTDRNKVIPITLDDYVASFLEKICNVYDTPPVFKFNDKVKNDQKARFNDLMGEVRINQIFQQNNIKMRLHNTLLNYVRYNADLDRIFIENDYTIGTCKVFPYAGFQYEPRAVAYETYNESDVRYWVVWDRLNDHEEHYFTKEEPKIETDTGKMIATREPIPGNDDTKAPDYWPWVVYRYREHNSEFWGNGMDWLINLCRTLNILLTITADDSIQQNIRLLIMNFTPEGTETADEHSDKTASQNKRLKVGMKHPIFPKKGSIAGDDQSSADAKVVEADLFLDKIVAFVKDLSDMTGSLQGVDSLLKREIQSNLSGIALAIQNQPKLTQWAKDIQILRPYDRQLIKTLIDVNNAHRAKNDTTKRIDPKIMEHLSIDYQRPKVITDEKAEYELERMKWENGTSSPILWVKSRYPEMDDAKAEKFIKENLEKWNALNGMGITVQEPSKEEE